MGPLGKLTSKLKSQPKEPQRNGRHISEAKGEPREQNQTLVHVGSKTSNDGFALLDVQHITDLTDGHVDEKTRQAVTSVQEETCESLEKDRERYLHHSMVAGTFSPSEHGGFGDAKIKRSWRDGIHNLNMQKPLETLAHIVSPKSRNEFRLGEGSENSFAVPAVSQKAEGVYESSDLDSSSLSLSLGLNRIKTRSGPLYSDGKDMDHDHFVAGNNLLTGSRVVTGGMGNDVALSQNPRSKDLAPGEVALSNFDVMVGDWEVEFGKSSMLSDSHKLQLTNRRKAKCESQRLQRGSSGRKASNQSFIPTLGRAFDSNNNYAVNENERVVRMKSVHAVPKVSNKSDHRLEKKVPSTLISYLKHELQEGAEMEATVKQLDVIREGESPTFNQSVPSISHSRILKKWPKDIKSFSHELGPRGGRPHDVHRPHSDNDLEEILAALRARFNTAKGEVDAELQFFAAALIGILDRNTDSFPGWKENVEDLLVLAQRCTKLSPIDFRRECENIVHRLDERRQELPLGLLKQLHTRMLFILTRCTRLLQFQKETSPEEEGLHKVQQCLKGVPSVERALPSGLSKRGKGTAASNTLLPEAVEHSARSDAGILKLKLAKKHKLSLGKKKFKHQLSTSPKVCQYDSNRVIGLQKTSFTCESFELRDSEKRLSKEFEENSSAAFHVPWDHADERLLDESSQQGTCPYKHINKDSWPHWLDTEKEEAEFVICRICEEEILTSHLEPHSLRCSWADAGDCQGVNLDERLRMLADYLEKIAELSTPKSNHMATDDSPDGYKTTRLNPLDVADNASPRSHELPGKALDGRMDDTCVSDSVGVEELRGLSLINFKRLLGVKADQGLASSSAGSGTPRSTLTTPRTSQLDLLWAERNSFVEQEDTSQIYELASFARDIARKHYTEVGVLESLGACLEELHEFLGQNKIIDLTIDTFGKRIEKLLREKIHLFGSMSDARKADSLSGSFEDDGMSTDDGVQSFKSTPTHSSYNDRITIADFDILKLISRGAFGRVFLAKKRATGDNFAIKVLRKIDMIRKNAVENILAERDILISVRNPFVVRFFYSFTCRENLYLVMEYLIGGDLYSLLRKLGCLEENVARVYIAELVLALEYLHSLGVVHRDLKPDNILIAHDGHIKLTDFGLSKVGLINSTDDLSGPTTGGMLMEENLFENGVEHGMQREYRKERSAVGTPDYLAPEILLGTEHGYTADWWSVGVILFELTTGLPPFNAEHPQIIFDNILNRKIPWPCVPEEMSQDAKDLIDKLLTEDPNQRLGAKGAAEVKNHPFFKDISWDNLARQKAAFVPSPESVDDTSYFTCRHQEVYLNSSPRFGDSSDCSTTCSSSNSFKAMLNEGEDDFGELQEFERSPSVERTFNNFSFKNASQLAYMNYDILSQSGRDATKGHSRHQSAS